MTLPERIDPSDSKQVSSLLSELLQQVTTLTAQNSALRKDLHRQSEEITKLQETTLLTNQSQSSLDQPSLKEPKAPLPEKFTGRQSDLRNFLASVKNVFQLQPSRFISSRLKTAFVGSLLVGDPLTWYRGLLESDSSLLEDYEEFVNDLKTNFGDPYVEENARKQLLALRQGNGRAASYAAKFRRIATDTGFNDDTLLYHFERGLNIEVQKAIAVNNQEFLYLEDLFKYAIKVDNRLTEFSQGRPKRYSDNFANHHYQRPGEALSFSRDTGPTPMDIGAISKDGRRKPLTQAQKEERYQKRLCFYCGGAGHMNYNCPQKTTPAKQIAAANMTEEESLNE